MKLLTFFISISSANYFIWDKYVNFNDTTRWDKNVTRPCLDSKIRFKSNLTISILVDIDFTISDMIMPENSELILDDGVLIGTDLRISNCQDESEYIFDAGPESWYDISKWKIYNRNPHSAGGQPVEFCLDTERIPCQSDNVEFQSTSTFALSTTYDPNGETTPPAATLLNLKFWNQVINSWSVLENMINTTTAIYNFGDSGFDFGVQSGCDQSGCICRADSKNDILVEDIICRQTDCSARVVDCLEPVDPFGHCCPICGAIITMSFDLKFVVANIIKVIDEIITTNFHYTINRIPAAEQDYYPIVPTLQKKPKKHEIIQILIMDKDGTGSRSKKIVQNLAKQIASVPGISNIEITTSGRPGGNNFLSGGHIFGIIVAVAGGCAALIFANKRYDLYYYAFQVSKISNIFTSTTSNITRKRTSNIASEEIGISDIDKGDGTDQNNISASRLQSGVVNPAYETVVMEGVTENSTSSIEENSQVEASSNNMTVETGIENPIFRKESLGELKNINDGQVFNMN